MIIVIEPHNAAEYPKLMEEMFRKRFDDPTRLGGYDQVLNCVGIQYWRMASTAPGMSL